MRSETDDEFLLKTEEIMKKQASVSDCMQKNSLFIEI